MKQPYTASVRTGWAAFIAPCLLLALLLARPTQAQTTSFACTGGSQTYTVPAGVTLLQVVATGATNGAVVRVTVTVTPTETLTVEVGGTGSLSGPSGGGSGTPYGYNGGGGSGFTGRGGGATDLRRSGPGTGDYLASRNALLVAGGGGGYGYSYVNDIDYPGGSGGAQTGGNGTGSGGYTGFGATPTAAGAAAAGATAGSANTGGARAGYGGSGGGGYYGGGGGNSSGNNQEAGGGGGGSSWVMPTGSSSISYATSAAAGNGTMTITPAPPATVISSFAPLSGLPGTAITLTGTGFTGATGVSFNGMPTTGLTVTSPTTLTAYVPVGATTGSLRVSTAGGTGTSAAAFTVTAIAPDVAAVTVTPAGPLSACGGPTLTAVATLKPFLPTGTGLNKRVNAVAVQPDGKLLVGGQFTTYNSAAANFIIRLNADGTRDAAFVPTGTSLNDAVKAITGQPDGKLLVGGFFTSYNGATANYVIRLNADGTRDATFVPTGTGLGNYVYAVAMQPDGKLLLGGSFNFYNNLKAKNLVRLNADGTKDATATAAPGVTYAWTPGGSTGATVVPGAAGGSYQATATVGGYNFLSNTVSVTTCVPTITSFSPTGGLPGTVVTLTGTNFTGATGVSFNGVPTTGLTVTSPTSLTAYVPVGATTGPLRVTAGGTGTSAAAFTVAAVAPDVAAVTVTPAGPLSACGGATLTAVATIKPFVTTGTGLNNSVLAVAVQPDGKLLLGGTFTSYDGATANRVIRLNANGSRDATFAPTGMGLDNIVRAVAVQPDGKVLLGGTFTGYDGALANRVIRLNANGTRDATFAPTGTGLGDAVQALAVQPDGKLLVGGFFTTYNGAAATRVIRLNADGTRDATFAPTGTGLNNTVQAVVVQPDGKLLLGGQFTTYNGAAATFVIRLNADGTRDATFAPTGSGPNNIVNVVAVQPDGQLLVGGAFTSYDVPVANPVVRLSANGTRDATFAPTGVGTNSNVRAVAVQPDGKLLVVGTFTGGNFVIRLNADGTRDAAFATTGTGFNGTVGKVALQPDGKLLLNGFFTTYDGTAAPYVIRLNADGTRDATATAAPGATYAWTPGNSTGATVVPTAAGGSYQATATVVGYDFLSNTVSVTACVPTLTSLDRTSGPVGTSVTLTGSNLTGATAVTFSGTSNNTVTTGLTVSGTGSSQTITVTVPTGAATGSVTVTTPGGTSNGLAFTVTVPVGDLTVDNTNSTAGVPFSIGAGTYNTITVTGTGFATLGGAVVVNTALAVSGTLLTSCQALTGAGSFTLVAGATLGICDADGLHGTGASGAVQVTGTRSFSADAAYVYNGSQAQSTGPGLPATVRALTVANPTEVGLTQAVTIAQTLTLAGAGNLRLNFNSLLLRSDASGTALVVNAGAGVVLGNTATMQRHIGTNTAATGYRHYASPMQAGSGAETLTTLATAGYAPDFSGAAAYNSSATPGAVTPFPTVFRYNQDRIAGLASTYGTFDKGWQAALGSEVPQAGRGYAVQAPGAVLVDFTGTLTSGSVSRSNLQRASTDANTGWHLLGNPFPSPLDWSTMSVGTTAADNLQNMDGAVYVSQSSGPYVGSYRTYLAAAPGLGSPIIPAGSGFFVHTTSPATPGTVRFTTANRVTSFGAQPAFGRGPDLRPQLTLELRGTGGRDAVTVYADPAATPGLDATYDAVKLPNPTGLNLSAQAGPNPLAIDGLPTFSAATVVPLSVGVPAAGSYALQVNQLLNLPAGTTAVLVDALLNTRTDLATLPAAGYVFSVSSAQAATLITGRFYLNLGAAGPLATTAGRAAPAMQLYPNPVRGGAATLTGAVPGTVVRVFDALGRLVTSAPANATGTAVLALPAGLATGVYVVRAGAGALRLTVE